MLKATLGAGSHPLPSLAGRLAASGASLGGPATLALHPLLGPGTITDHLRNSVYWSFNK